MSLYEGFKIKWAEKRKNSDRNEHEEELENYGCKMSNVEGAQSFFNRDLVNHNMNYKLDDGMIAIVNSYDGAVHPVARH